jgi:hypothetical protein
MNRNFAGTKVYQRLVRAVLSKRLLSEKKLMSGDVLSPVCENVKELRSSQKTSRTKNPAQGRAFLYGALGRIRTSDRSVRSRVLYPAELRVHKRRVW